MAKIDFGIIFSPCDDYLDNKEKYLKIDSVFFSLDEIIKTGIHKNKRISDLNMINVKFENKVNTYDLMSFDKRLFQIINGDYSFGVDEKLEVLTEYCVKLHFNKILIINNTIEHPTNNTIRARGDVVEGVKNYYKEQIYNAMIELERELNPYFDEKPTDVLEIINKLKLKVKGQDEVIDSLVSNILLNQNLIETEDMDLIRTSKTNILLDGSTGTGKTLMVSELANLINRPIIIRSATNFSTVGYKGDALETILSDLLRKTGGDLSKAKRGIICFDEIDKLGDTSLEMRKGIMQELLSWINGTIIKTSLDRKEYSFDTSLLTFIFLGAFSKIKDSKPPIGFNSIKEVKSSTKDYIEYGMDKEFIGRLNLQLTLNDLDRNIMLDILNINMSYI